MPSLILSQQALLCSSKHPQKQRRRLPSMPACIMPMVDETKSQIRRNFLTRLWKNKSTTIHQKLIHMHSLVQQLHSLSLPVEFLDRLLSNLVLAYSCKCGCGYINVDALVEACERGEVMTCCVIPIDDALSCGG